LGTRAWNTVKNERLSQAALRRATQRAGQRIGELTLKELRQQLEVTQATLAATAQMTQSELSRLERRADHRVSTVRRYIEALGGRMEITAIVGKKRLKLVDL
jgi:predicted transcriptional regulator